jgi:hypothetical protein
LSPVTNTHESISTPKRLFDNAKGKKQRKSRTCTICGNQGHDKRTCPKEQKELEGKEKANSRKRKETSTIATVATKKTNTTNSDHNDDEQEVEMITPKVKKKIQY